MFIANVHSVDAYARVDIIKCDAKLPNYGV